MDALHRVVEQARSSLNAPPAKPFLFACSIAEDDAVLRRDADRPHRPPLTGKSTPILMTDAPPAAPAPGELADEDCEVVDVDVQPAISEAIRAAKTRPSRVSKRIPKTSWARWPTSNSSYRRGKSLPFPEIFLPVPALDMFSAVIFGAVAIGVAIATVNRPAYGVAALLVFDPFDFSHALGPTTITFSKVALLGLIAGLAARRAPLRPLRSPEIRPLLFGAIAIAVATALAATQADYRTPALREIFKALEYAVCSPRSSSPSRRTPTQGSSTQR